MSCASCDDMCSDCTIIDDGQDGTLDCVCVLDNCGVCTSATVCSECDTGYFIEDNECSECGSHCDTCDDADTCTVCSTDYDSTTGEKTEWSMDGEDGERRLLTDGVCDVSSILWCAMP